MKTATKYIFQWYDNVNTIEFPISVRNSQESRRLLCMHFEKMQRMEYHFQSEWVSPPARLIFRSICGQQVSVAIAARARPPSLQIDRRSVGPHADFNATPRRRRYPSTVVRSFICA